MKKILVLVGLLCLLCLLVSLTSADSLTVSVSDITGAIGPSVCKRITDTETEVLCLATIAVDREHRRICEKIEKITQGYEDNVEAALEPRSDTTWYALQIALQGDGLTPEERERIFWEVLEQTLMQIPPSEQKNILMVGTGSWMNTDPNRRRHASDIDATFMYIDDKGNEDLNGAVQIQQMFNANLRARAPTADITLFVDEADEGEQDFYRGPTGKHFFYTHSKANNPNSAFNVSLEGGGQTGSRLVREPLPVEEFWKRRGKDVPENIGDAYKFVEDNQIFLDSKLRDETDPVKRAVIIAKYVDRVEHWLKDAISKQWGKSIPVKDLDLLPLVDFADCLRDRFPVLPPVTVFDTLEAMASSEVKDKVKECLGAQSDAELEQRVAKLYNLTQKYFGTTRDQVDRAEQDTEKARGESTLPSSAGAQGEADEELQDCLCRCLEPPGGQFSCSYDTEDRGWSPSCRDLSNGPCICKAYGCFRGPLPTEGECYDNCYAKYAQEKPEAEEGEEKQPSRFIKPTLLEEFLRSQGYDESACPKKGDPPPGSVKFWSKVPGGGEIAHSSVMLSNDRQIEMGHKQGGRKFISEILPPGKKPTPSKGNYSLQKTLCPPPTYHFDNDYSEKMEGIDREYDTKSTHWNCHGFSARVVYNCVETGIRMKPITDFDWKGKTLVLNGGEVWGDVIPLTIQIPQGAVQFGSEYTIEVRNDNTTIIYLIKGKADYKGIEHSLSLSSGQMGVIDPTGTPLPPTTFNISEMDLWWTKLNFFSETSQEKEGLTFESNSKPSGSNVQIPLTLNGIEDKIGNMDITLSYDPSVLEAKAVTKGDLTSDSLFEYNIMAGTILICLADADGFSGNGSIAYVTFDVTGATGSTSPLQIAALTANQAEDYEALTIPTNDGVFRVESGLTVSVSDTTGAKGSTVEVPINLEGATEVGSMDIFLNYDANILSAVDVEAGALGKNALIESNTAKEGAVIT